MTKFNFNGTEIFVNATFVESVNNVWGDNQWHNKFHVTMRTANGKTAFTFYDSTHNYNAGKYELNADDLKGCIDCYLSDASCYDCSRDFEDFCNEMGYTSMSDYKRAKFAFNGCKRHYEGAIRLFGAEYYEIANAINESY